MVQPGGRVKFISDIDESQPLQNSGRRRIIRVMAGEQPVGVKGFKRIPDHSRSGLLRQSLLPKIRAQMKSKLIFPVFAMGRRPARTLAAFRATPGSILLATGAAWEGLDFAGDSVSMLIIPRLPFAYPDAVKEKERENYPCLRDFLQSVVVPEMQIKLRQGFGRAIRMETDACAVAILDPRAACGHRYFANVKAALPKMPVTGSLREVAKFYQAKKDAGYFGSALHQAG